jgi:hypothetical protein
VCVCVRAQDLPGAREQTRRRLQQSLCNFLHPRRTISCPQAPTQGKSLDYESVSEETQTPIEGEALSLQRKTTFLLRRKALTVNKIFLAC